MLSDERIKHDFAERLSIACANCGLKEKGRGIHIANAMGLSTKAVSKWFNAETMPSASNIYVLAKLLDTTPEWLMFGDKNATVVSKKSFSYPLLSSIQAGTWTDSCDLSNSEGYEFIESLLDVHECSFFLKLTGDSMKPKFSEGDLVLINPKLQPHPGDFVAAVNGSGEATFKQYKELGEISESSGRPHFELVPLNPLYPTLSTKNQDIRIIGIGVEHRSYL
ncbi:LexA family protein [Pasteurella multocida]|uniref:LexA family protein n=1 Tax=Pasteurella multocida TaxID=747 RepID=UPI001F537434|nr:S24 family peptidase [Pasteurella multocida]